MANLEQYNHTNVLNLLQTCQDASIKNGILKDLRDFDFEFFSQKFKEDKGEIQVNEERYSGELYHNLVRGDQKIRNDGDIGESVTVSEREIFLQGLETVYKGGDIYACMMDCRLWFL